MGFFIPLRATSGWLGGTVPSGQFAVPLALDGMGKGQWGSSSCLEPPLDGTGIYGERLETSSVGS